MEIKEKYQLVYSCAIQQLNEMLPAEMTTDDLQKYFVGDNKDFKTMEDVFEQMIMSAQNYQAMPNVIQFEKRQNEIKQILYDYDISKIRALNEETLYYTFRKAFNVTSKDTKRNLWRKWSMSIIDAADFLCKFKDVEDFKSFVALFDHNPATRMALPLFISTKIRGIGFALACDTLKELGYLQYPKPDVHLIDVFSKLGLCKNDPICVFESIVEMAEACADIDNEVTPYKIDKIIWLICSGKFYLDGISVGKKKDLFINIALMKIS